MAVRKVGLAQSYTGSDWEAKIKCLIEEAAEREARSVMLPEYAPYPGPKEG